jgi:antitoxin (DNA-binding transcriptional repressor) of toxin-antitoxin stability system
MKTISLSKIRAELTSVIKALESGPVAIQKHGKTVAVLSAPGSTLEASPRPPATTGPAGAPKSPDSRSVPLIDVFEIIDDEPEEQDPDLDLSFESYLASQESDPVPGSWSNLTFS